MPKKVKSTGFVICPFLLQNDPAKKCRAKQNLNPTFRCMPTRSKSRKSTVTFYMHPELTCPSEGKEIKGCPSFDEFIEKLDRKAWIMTKRERREYLWTKQLQVSLLKN